MRQQLSVHPGKMKPGSVIRMNVDMVLVPVTVTDPMNRLVTGLEKEDFPDFGKQWGAEDQEPSRRRTRRFPSGLFSTSPDR